MPAYTDFKKFVEELTSALHDFVSGLSGVEKKRQEIIDTAIITAKQKKIDELKKRIDSM